MADISDIQSADSVKIVGSSSTGVEGVPVQSTTQGGLHTNLRDSSGNELLGQKNSANSIPVVIAQEPTYVAAASAFVCAANATDVFTIAGSATKTIKINKIKVSGTTTSGTPIRFTAQLIRRSSTNTGGNSVIDVNASYDSTNPSATAVVRHYTTNPASLGASAGTIRAESLAITASGLAGGTIEWNFRESNQPIVLRGTTEILAVNFNGSTITGPVISIVVEWSEI